MNKPASRENLCEPKQSPRKACVFASTAPAPAGTAGHTPLFTSNSGAVHKGMPVCVAWTKATAFDPFKPATRTPNTCILKKRTEKPDRQNARPDHGTGRHRAGIGGACTRAGANAPDHPPVHGASSGQRRWHRLCPARFAGQGASQSDGLLHSDRRRPAHRTVHQDRSHELGWPKSRWRTGYPME